MRRAAAFVLLLSTWTLLFFQLTMMTELIFSPWDTAPVRPELGTWQRTLNDFFETSPGNLSIAIPVIGASALLVLPALRRTTAAVRFGVANLVFLGVLVIAFMLAALLNNWLFPYPPVLYDPTYQGYHRSLLPGGVMLGVCAAWLLWQRRAVSE